MNAQIITTDTQQELGTTTPHQLEQFRQTLQLTLASPDIASRRPIAQTIQSCLAAAANKSTHTHRAYTKSVAQFIQFLESERGQHCAGSWLPFCTESIEGKKVVYQYNESTPSAILWLVDAALLDLYALQLSETDRSSSSVNARVNAARTFLSVALRDNVLTLEQGQQLGLKPYRTKQVRAYKVVGRRLSVQEVRLLRASISGDVDFSVSSSHANELDTGEFSPSLQDAFLENGYISPQAEQASVSVLETSRRWLVVYGGTRYMLELQGEDIHIGLELRNKQVRDRAIIDCMLFAGLRREEVVNLTASSIQIDQGRYYLFVDGKGNKKRKLKVHDELYKSLTAWMRTAQINFHLDTPLFTSINRHNTIKPDKIDANVVERITGEYAFKAGIAPEKGKYKLSPHDLRRTCGRNAYENGATLLQVQLLLGHADPKTTAQYIGLDQEVTSTAVDCVRY